MLASKEAATSKAKHQKNEDSSSTAIEQPTALLSCTIIALACLMLCPLRRATLLAMLRLMGGWADRWTYVRGLNHHQHDHHHHLLLLLLLLLLLPSLAISI